MVVIPKNIVNFTLRTKINLTMYKHLKIRILALVMLFAIVWTTTDAVAQTPRAYAVWTEGNKTLTFFVSVLNYYPGDMYGDQHITKLWKGDAVLNTPPDNTAPWCSTIRSVVECVVFDPSFALARPTSTAWWFENYCDTQAAESEGASLKHIYGIEYLNTSEVTSMYSMFYGCSGLTELDVSHFDTHNVTNMSWMFAGCRGLRTLDVSHFETSMVINMSFMFQGCWSMLWLDVDKFDTGNVCDMSYMFSDCNNLRQLDVYNFKTGNVTDMSNMFSFCYSLTELDVSQFRTGLVEDMSWMFACCAGLSVLDVKKFDTHNVTDMNNMFADCTNLIFVDTRHFYTVRRCDREDMFSGCDMLAKLTY